ncbi:GGDEF domain-containing protein [bacterium]|nr:GGDEF domain-containing protein [candidate division CSSED10-310 bacterium]
MEYMKSTGTRNIPGNLLWPSGIVFLITLPVVITARHNPELARHFLSPYLYAVYLTGIGLGLVYRRHRQSLFLILIGVADFTWIRLFTIQPAAQTGYGDPLKCLAVLIPLHLMTAVWIRERRFFSLINVLRFGIIGLEIFLWMAVFRFFPSAVHEVLTFRIIPGGIFDIPPGQPAGLAWFAALAVIVAKVWKQPQSVTTAYLFATVATGGAFVIRNPNPSDRVFFPAAGLIVISSILDAVYRMAYRDELTGLPGRRALNQYLGQLDTQYTVAMIDIDHFKKINDRYGHDTGDQILRMISSRLDSVGGGGRVFRFGGEEFAVIFPGLDAKSIRTHLENLRQAIATQPFYLRGRRRPRNKTGKAKRTARKTGGIKVTVSVGFAASSPTRPLPDQAIRAADKALYQAKRAGRNRVAGRP